MKRVCKYCNLEMEKMEDFIKSSDATRVWDLGVTGLGTTGNRTTSVRLDYDCRKIVLKVYQCLHCGRKESYRE